MAETTNSTIDPRQLEEVEQMQERFVTFCKRRRIDPAAAKSSEMAFMVFETVPISALRLTAPTAAALEWMKIKTVVDLLGHTENDLYMGYGTGNPMTRAGISEVRDCLSEIADQMKFVVR